MEFFIFISATWSLIFSDPDLTNAIGGKNAKSTNAMFWMTFEDFCRVKR
jgi:hypothetical protein